MSVAKTNSYHPSPIVLELGEGFTDAVAPAKFPKHILRFRNQEWAERVGLNSLTNEEWEKHFARFEPLPGNLPQPLALRYHGHQFQAYNPELGDGRGFLFAQLKDARDERVLDLGTKGSGQTPYSRRGDGRLTLKGAVREVLATEMLEALGVYTSKTFSVFETGEELERYDEPSPTRSGVLVRLSHSHIRFGTFQRLAFFRDTDRMRVLVDYCMRNYFPHLANEPQELKPAAFLQEVALRSADLCASWMLAGFVHGVLNTDNMNITGESFDYGPYRFLPVYDPNFTAAYFDQSGLYAYGRQPETVLWNLDQLGSCLTLLSETEPLADALKVFAARFNSGLVFRLMDRLGLVAEGEKRDAELFVAAFNFLAASQIGYEQFFHDWYGGIASAERAKKSPEAAKYAGEHYETFLASLKERHASDAARKRLTDSYFQRERPCSLLIDEIEWIWEAIDKNDDWSRFEAKVADIRAMGKVYERREV